MVVVVVVWEGVHSGPDTDQDWGRGFILLLPQAAVLSGSDAGIDGVEPASGFVIQNRQTNHSSRFPMCGAQ